MAPRLWLWLHVATAIVAVSCAYHRERHPHNRRSRMEHLNSLGTSLLNVTSVEDDSNGSGRSVLRPLAEVPSQRAHHQGELVLPRHGARRHQRHRHRRRLHSHRGPDIVYSFGSQAAPKLLYRGNKYHVGPYSGYVDVWTIERKPRPPSVPRPRQPTPRPRPSTPSPSHKQEKEDRFPEGTVFARVLIAPENSVTPARPAGCLRCPKDHTVWVGPGFSCAEVPRPRLRGCSRLSRLPGEVHITATMGPQPGSLVMEGVYDMAFTFKAPGVESQSCHYKLKVKVVRCPALRRPEHGGMRCSRGRHWGSRCRFFCKPGFELSSQRVATRCAIHDGARVTWTPHPPPVCRDKNTPRPNPTTNTIVPSTSLPSTAPSTELITTTKSSQKVPSSSSSPRPTKRWKQLACRWPRAPLHGWVSCDRGAARKPRVVAREGTRCRQGCRWAPQEAVAHFSCVAGAWQGRKPLVCARPPADSTAEPPPTTERVPRGCAPPVAAPEQHGLWSCGPGDAGLLVAPGGECVFACHRDYYTDEDSARLAARCSGDRWNHTAAPVCKKSGCESPPPVPQSTLKCSGNPNSLGLWPVHTTCSHLCDEGYEVPASQLSLVPVTCLPGGSWDHQEQPQCVRAGCASPVPVPDSEFECSSDANNLGYWPTGAVCKVVCVPGFVLGPPSFQSRDQFVCQGDGTWDQTAELQCQRVTCESPRDVPNSVLECSNGTNDNGRWSVGTLCQYACNQGFASPESPVAVSCREDGTWSQSPQLHCNGVTCQSPQDVAGSILECTNGTSDNGKWSVGTLCQYTCNDGYAIPEIQKALNPFLCRGDGTWNLTEQLNCEEIGCVRPSEVAHSAMNCTEGPTSLGKLPPGTLCSYECNEGYVFEGNDIVFNRFICRGDGTWNQTEELRCRKSGCEDPSSLQYSMVNCSGSVNNFGRWPTGTVCSHVCEEGYELSRDHTHLNLFICLHDGTWNQTQGLHCAESGCEEPRPIAHSSLNCSSGVNVLGKRPLGTHCSHVCEEGFAIRADQESFNRFTCSEDGSWNQTDGLVCEKTGCETPRLLENALLDCSESANAVGNWPSGTTCKHICKEGFVIPRSQQHLNKILCLDDGSWNETDNLQCAKLADPQLSQGCRDEAVVVDGGSVTFPVAVEAPTFTAFNGTNAVVNCSAWDATNFGTFRITCEAVDVELGTNSTCTFRVMVLAPGCPPFQSDPYSLVKCSEVSNATVGTLHPVGDVCEYICQQAGYVIPTSKLDWAAKECLPNGSWSNDNFNLCEKLLAPVKESGCEDVRIGIDVPVSTAVPVPVYRGGSGELVKTTCTPSHVADFGEHQISCQADDLELRSSASCAFKVIVKGDTVPQLREPGRGCVDVQEVHDAYPVIVKPPAYKAASGGDALVTCEPATLLGPGAYNVTCTARDNKTQAETQCSYLVNARQIEQFRESQCLSLKAPANGNIQCKRRQGLITCRFSCSADYVMNTKPYPLLARGYVVCDRAQGDRFDFQEDYGISELPACTRLPSPTYFQGSLAFRVGLPSCSLEKLQMDFMPTVTEALLDRAAEMCLQAICNNVTFVCETDIRRNTSASVSAAMKVVWTVQARHNVNVSYDIPEAEILIEQIQVLTHDIVTSDTTFQQEVAEVGGEVWPESFRQSKFTLVCASRGFAIDDATALCVECSRGTFEEHGSCHPCPENHYQDLEGQTSCKPCPKHTFSFQGAKMAEDCTEFGGPHAPPPARDVSVQHLHERRDPCFPNPCQNQGVCYLERGGYGCLCQQRYKGRHCHQPA